MPEKEVLERAKRDLKEGTSPSTAAGEFVREEIEHVRQGKHGARSPQQAIAIGLSEARRAGIPLPPPREGQTSGKTRRSAQRAYEVGQKKRRPRSPSRKRSAAVEGVLKQERRSSASRAELSKASRSSWARRKKGARAAPRQAVARTTKRRSSSRRRR
jgi:Family of unknown function (DUF6496)